MTLSELISAVSTSINTFASEKDSAYATLLADFNTYKLAHPVVTPPPPPPPPTGWPSASNTGVPVGTVLTASGSITSTANGQVIEGKNISGGVTIKHDNVLMRKCKVTSGAFIPITCRGHPTFRMEDCEIIGTGTAGSSGIDGYGKFYRLNVHGFENNFNITGGNGVGGGIYDSYLWGLKASGSPHYDTIQIDGDVSNFEIIHNTVINDYGQTSAIMIDNFYGPISNITVDNNRLVGGGFTVYSDGQFSGGSITGVKITNNRMKKGGYDYVLIRNNNAVFTGNVDDATDNSI